MPGVSGLGGSTMSIFTGTRWVILVKLPDGLGVGSSAKRAVVALPMRATLADEACRRDRRRPRRCTFWPSFSRPTWVSLMLASTQTSFGIVQQQDALAGLRRTRPAARRCGRSPPAPGCGSCGPRCRRSAGHLRREVGHLVVECGDLRVDHAQPVKLDPRLVEAAFGLLVLGLELQDLAFELRHRGLRRWSWRSSATRRSNSDQLRSSSSRARSRSDLQRGQRLFAHRDRWTCACASAHRPGSG